MKPPASWARSAVRLTDRRLARASDTVGPGGRSPPDATAASVLAVVLPIARQRRSRAVGRRRTRRRAVPGGRRAGSDGIRANFAPTPCRSARTGRSARRPGRRFGPCAPPRSRPLFPSRPRPSPSWPPSWRRWRSPPPPWPSDGCGRSPARWRARSPTRAARRSRAARTAAPTSPRRRARWSAPRAPAASCTPARSPGPEQVVSVRCGDRRVSYLPLAAVAVRAGATIRAGAPLGTVAAGHGGLHLGVRRERDRVRLRGPAAAARRARPPSAPATRPRARPARPRLARPRAAPLPRVATRPAPLPRAEPLAAAAPRRWPRAAAPGRRMPSRRPRARPVAGLGRPRRCCSPGWPGRARSRCAATSRGRAPRRRRPSRPADAS